MHEYFVVANSNAAPIVSDTSTEFQQASDAEDAGNSIRLKYNHPFGLYALVVYEDANAYHKGKKPLYRWLSDRALKSEKHG
jgi:hypothetical protein